MRICTDLTNLILKYVNKLSPPVFEFCAHSCIGLRTEGADLPDAKNVNANAVERKQREKMACVE